MKRDYSKMCACHLVCRRKAKNHRYEEGKQEEHYKCEARPEQDGPASGAHLLKQVLRPKHHSVRTEQTNIGWICRSILVNAWRHPREMGADEVGVPAARGRAPLHGDHSEDFAQQQLRWTRNRRPDPALPNRVPNKPAILIRSAGTADPINDDAAGQPVWYAVIC